MAFSSMTIAATDTELDDPINLYVGDTKACKPVEFGAKLIPSNSTTRLLAAYAEEGNTTAWVRVLQRGKKTFLETAMPDIQRRNIDPALAASLSSRLAEDISRNAFLKSSDEMQLDGIWYLFTADGKSCVTVPWISRNSRTRDWTRIFATLSSKSASSEAMTWLWLDRFGQIPATLPTSLPAGTADYVVKGAASAWKHSGAEPLTILNHRASVSERDIRIVGEVANYMDTALEELDVVATFYDANGSVLATETTSAEYELLPQGARSPFDLKTTAKGVASYTLRIEPGDAISLRPPSVQIEDHHMREDDGDLIVRGTVRNVGTIDEKFIEVQVSLYDEAGGLLDTDSDYAGELLRAGASVPFEVQLERPRDYHHYEVQVNPDYRELRK